MPGIDHVCSVTQHFCRSFCVSAPLRYPHQMSLQITKPGGLASDLCFHDQASFLGQFYTWKDTMISHFKKLYLKKNTSPLLFSSLSGLLEDFWFYSKLSWSILCPSSSAIKLCSLFPSHFLFSFFDVLMMSDYYFLTVFLARLWAPWSVGIIFYLYFHAFVRIAEVNWQRGGLVTGEDGTVYCMFMSLQNSPAKILTPVWWHQEEGPLGGD